MPLLKSATHRARVRVLSEHHAVVTKHPGLQLAMGAGQGLRTPGVQLTSQAETGKLLEETRQEVC